MYPQPNHFSRNIGLIIVGLLVAIGILALSVVTRTPRVSVSHHLAVPASLATAATTSDGKFVGVENGQFVLYDPSTGTSKIIGPSQTTTGLTTIDSLQLHEQWLLFHTNVVPAGSLLGKLLTSKHLSTSADYWWVYDTKQQTFQPLPTGTLLARFDGNLVVGLAVSQAGESLHIYNASDITSVKTLTIPNSIDFQPVTDGFLLQTAQNHILYTKDGVVSQTITSSGALVGVSPSQHAAILQLIGQNSRSLARLDLTTHKLQVVAKNIGDKTAWNPGGIVLYSHAKGNAGEQTGLLTYELASGKTVQWQTGNPKFDSANPVSVLTTTSGLVQQTSTQYQLLSNGTIK